MLVLYNISVGWMLIILMKQEVLKFAAYCKWYEFSDNEQRSLMKSGEWDDTDLIKYLLA